jgi:hypothetical protein
VEVVDLMRLKSRTDKIAIQRQLASVSFAEALLNNARQGNLKGDRRSGRTRPSYNRKR